MASVCLSETNLYVGLSSEAFTTDVTDIRFPLTMSQHVLLHIPSPSQLFVTNVTLVVATNIVRLSHMVLIVGLVVELRLASLACVGLGLAGANLQMGLEVAVADKLLLAHFTLESFSLRERNVLLEVSHDL